MKYIWLYIGLFLVGVVITYFHFSHKELSVIKYFPIDEERKFETASTTLAFKESEGDDEYEIEWEIFSKSDEPAYLRQDVSLLFVNGRLKGVVNKWKQDVEEIHKVSFLHGEDTKRYEALSVHHGEYHEDDTIKSIQAVSNDRLYIIDSPHTKRFAFHKPKSQEEEEWQKKLDHSINQQLEAQWAELMEYYQLSTDQYITAPLTELANYTQKNPFPYTDPEQFDRISGQLWEGLYKNYVLGIKDSESSHPIQSYEPLLLFDKKGTHLMVLFEDDQGKNHQLIQYY
ncbi:hypothetical protein [Halobacillus sp. Marseille-Q1614]|uniref:hypothetical protein n=1 Tax=Halobacillus sp. Marseille-Q1614 TaxID=2709134 RepID=UPI00156DDC42|nr:hypothetical protein [Halobacillus sp. Marseille-Q1614]